MKLKPTSTINSYSLKDEKFIKWQEERLMQRRNSRNIFKKN